MNLKTWFDKLPTGWKFVLVERILTVLTRGVDALMIYIIWYEPDLGALGAFIIVTPVNLLFCSLVVFGSDVLKKYGTDLTGIEQIRRNAEEKGGLKRWVLRRRTAIFLIGSWLYLDPDYVTLFLRKDTSFWKNTWRITFPSTILAMLVWTPIYWAAHEGYAWAIRLVEFF